MTKKGCSKEESSFNRNCMHSTSNAYPSRHNLGQNLFDRFLLLFPCFPLWNLHKQGLVSVQGSFMNKIIPKIKEKPERIHWELPKLTFPYFSSQSVQFIKLVLTQHFAYLSLKLAHTRSIPDPRGHPQENLSSKTHRKVRKSPRQSSPLFCITTLFDTFFG